jgi:transposase-like protein
MVLEPVHCPKCDKIDVVKNGKSSQGKQRYLCRNQECCGRTFIQQYTYRGYLPEVKQHLTEMAMNSSGMRDTARVLKISRNTVTAVLKKTSTATAGQ